MKTDILIAGSGCAGLYCALHLPKDKEITIITKSDVDKSDSFLAQGGMCVLKDESDYESFFEDTLRAGHYENDRESVEIMIRSSRDVVNDLLSYGVYFQLDTDGGLDYTREGGHSGKRIVYHEDTTGKAITEKLLEEAGKRENIAILEHTSMLDILCDENGCAGAVIRREDGSIEPVFADFTVWATGGVGGLYRHSTNFRHLTGDALAMAIRHEIALKDIDYVQIHPTTLYSEKEEDRSFLISESVRGEGAKLYDKDMNRFVNELLPRDRLTAAIREQMKKDGSEHVWEDLRPIPQKELMMHFPNILEHCRNAGYDVGSECIPVVPAQHYFMGGVKVDHESRTSMKRLYAVGETACNGVHGKNRLASNSLLESLVFAKRAAGDMYKQYQSRLSDVSGEVSVCRDTANEQDADESVLTARFAEQIAEIRRDEDRLAAQYRELILREMEKAAADRRRKGSNRFDPVTMKLNVEPLLLSALREDITSEDVSTNSVMPVAAAGEADLICKQDGIICGLQIFERVFTLLDETLQVEFYVQEGDAVKAGQKMAKVKGDIRAILSGERTALNYLQRMSGIATYTHEVASYLEGTKTKLLDTRKTTPNMRIFEKYAVRIGGGSNHRLNLSDGVMLKDNHIGAAGGVKEAVELARSYASFVRKIEVEVENLQMVQEAVEAGADIIMLDNMSHEDMEQAITLIDGRAEVEVSGNVTKENIKRLSDLGVDYVSSGALTHSAPILDVSLKNLHPAE